ncbi:hypothetical protein BD410DRAFT_375503 [Rickenella mellea]|uniref:Uncharacterized protein n=1 Tax=Rickenella mellea TaxID=50990 RepID=A0A4Y7Q076_9AGAM|nr:hypothetical protein BD410DRAFT_375503 [Rickenella mellea]
MARRSLSLYSFRVWRCRLLEIGLPSTLNKMYCIGTGDMMNLSTMTPLPTAQTEVTAAVAVLEHMHASLEHQRSSASTVMAFLSLEHPILTMEFHTGAAPRVGPPLQQYDTVYTPPSDSLTSNRLLFDIRHHDLDRELRNLRQSLFINHLHDATGIPNLPVGILPVVLEMRV